MKKVVLALTSLLVLTLAGCSLGGRAQVNNESTTPTPTTAQTSGNVFTSIKDALSKSLTLQCSYPDATGKTTVTTYIKNGAIRVSNVSMAEKSGNAIMKDNQMWVWNDTDKTGMILSFNTTEASPTGKQTPSTSQTSANNNNPGGSILDNLEKFKQYCKPGVVADSMFTPPTDVKFTDLSKAMQNLGKDLQKNLPNGIPTAPETVTPPSGY